MVIFSNLFFKATVNLGGKSRKLTIVSSLKLLKINRTPVFYIHQYGMYYKRIFKREEHSFGIFYLHELLKLIYSYALSKLPFCLCMKYAFQGSVVIFKSAVTPLTTKGLLTTNKSFHMRHFLSFSFEILSMEIYLL